MFRLLKIPLLTFFNNVILSRTKILKMAIGVDTSKWKPRKITGTPAAKFRNALGVGILGFGLLWGAFFQLSNITEPMKKAAEVLYEDPIEEVERKIMIASGMHIRSGDKLRRLMEEEKRIDLPDK